MLHCRKGPYDKLFVQIVCIVQVACIVCIVCIVWYKPVDLSRRGLEKPGYLYEAKGRGQVAWFFSDHVEISRQV